MVTGENGECYALKNKQWKHLFNLKVTSKNPYAGTGSVVLDGKLLVNGGKVGRKAYKATELVSTEGSTVSHDMPKVGFGHCNIKINESTILIAGLNWGTGYSETFFQNVVTGHFTPGPKLNPRL